MNKLFEFLRTKKVVGLPTPIIQKEEEEQQTEQNRRIKTSQVVETQTEMDYEFYKSKIPDLSDYGYVDHIIEDLKGGNLKSIKIEEAQHWVQFATMCKTWHPNPKYTLRRSFAMAVSEFGGTINLSMSENAHFFDGMRTYREKRKQQVENKDNRSLVPGFNKKEEQPW